MEEADFEGAVACHIRPTQVGVHLPGIGEAEAAAVVALVALAVVALVAEEPVVIINSIAMELFTPFCL